MLCPIRLLRRRLPGFAVLLLLAGAAPRAVMAASLSSQEVQVLGKALAFMQPLPPGATTIASFMPPAMRARTQTPSKSPRRSAMASRSALSS